MITPRPDQNLLTERPSPRIPKWMRIVAPIASAFRTKSRDDSTLDRELQTLLSDVSQSTDRADLEAILGHPAYAMIGDSYGIGEPDGEQSHPDLVECYSRGRLNVELWFRDGMVWQTIGFLMPTSWDFVRGIDS